MTKQASAREPHKLAKLLPESGFATELLTEPDSMQAPTWPSRRLFNNIRQKQTPDSEPMPRNALSKPHELLAAYSMAAARATISLAKHLVLRQTVVDFIPGNLRLNEDVLRSHPKPHLL